MTGRGVRASGQSAAGGASRAGPSRPTLTRTQMLRQAKSAAVVQKETREKPGPSGRGGGPSARGVCPGVRTGLAKLGPPPADPKKIDFTRPGMTKAMMMRQKAAEQKLEQERELQRQKEEAKRRPRRTPAPIQGDARLGRDKSAVGRRGRDAGGDFAALEEAVARGHIAQRRRDPKKALDEAIERGHIVTERRGGKPRSKLPPGGPPRSPRRGPAATGTPTPEVEELARSMNAEVLQAVPIGDGPVDKIIIPPGTVHDDRSTIVCIAPSPVADISGGAGASQIANRSIQVISETLDEQDAVESAAVQGKLEELQLARREFVMAVANVGGNAVNIAEEGDLSILNLDEMSDGFDVLPTPPRQRRIIQLPDISHEMFQVEYDIDHPTVQAARDFSRKIQMNMEQREAERRMEEHFASLARQDLDDFRLDAPLEQDIMEGDISFEEDEEGNVIPCPSRIKASMPPIPRRTEVCPERRTNVKRLERFFDLERYPPTPKCPGGPPPGREGLHPDLWDIEDPWYREEPQPDVPDLINFDSF